MAETLADLMTRYPLLPGWSVPELFNEDFSLGGLKLQLVGLASRHAERGLVTGSAAESSASALPRAYFELLERMAILTDEHERRDAYEVFALDGRSVGTLKAMELFPHSPNPDLWRYAKSNGIALHTSFLAAGLSAVRELVERDRVLRSWLGATTPKLMPSHTLASITSHFDVQVYDFGQTHVRGLGCEVHVVGIFAFPLKDAQPLIFGFGAGFDKAEAELKAMKECSQRLGFLWSEEIAAEPPAPAPSPDFHQDYFMRPECVATVKHWLKGGHAAELKGLVPELAEISCTTVDLTPAAFRGKVAVAKAVASEALPLTFGLRDDGPWAKLPAALRAHPFS